MTIRYGIIGTGWITEAFLAGAAGVPGMALRAVCSRSEERGREFAARHGADLVFTDPARMAASPDIDAVYIASPNVLHAAQSRLFLENGKHVLCEKAITLNSAELDEARAIADEHNVVLMDATTVLHMPLYQELRRRMDAGEFGRMNLAQLNFGSYKEYGDLTNRFYNRSLAGGAMLVIGVYALSVMRLFMASQPAEVVSLGNTCETGVDVAGGIVCRNAEQQLGVVSLTLHSKQPKRSVISFDKCYIEVNDYPRADHATIVWTADGHREEVHAGTEAYALCYEMADLEKAVAGDDSKRELLGYASDVMELMTKLRADWGVVYPEEE